MFGLDKLMLKRYTALEKRVNDIDEHLIEAITQIANIRHQIASLSGQSAVAAREKRKEPSYKSLLESMLGGKVVAIGEKDGGEFKLVE